MPVAQSESGISAMDILAESLSSPTIESKLNVKETDLAFLSALMNDTVVQNLVKAYDSLSEAEPDPESCNSIETVQDIQDLLDGATSTQARELNKILNKPHFKALILAHDDVAAKNFEDEFVEMPPFIPPAQIFPVPPTEAIRMVGVRKSIEEPLGITVKNETGDLVISRIMTGSMVDKQGLLHEGDIIKEINGQEVSDPDQLQELMRKASGSVTFKIIPSALDHSHRSQVFLKTHFSYDPKKDNLIPCREAGLPFKEGEILLVQSMEDPNWWQAKKVDDNGNSGLIPSQTLEEKRKAFVRKDNDYTHKSLLCGLMTKKKKKLMYQTKQSAQFDRHDLMVYEEVHRMPPFGRKCLILVGAQGVGRRTLKEKLIKADPRRFGQVIPHTSRPQRQGERDGDAYWFMDKEDMQKSINKNEFLEWGEFDGNLYGTKYDSIRQVIRSGKVCILDLNPQALKGMKTPEFMPYIVFVAAPPVDIMRNMNADAINNRLTVKIKTEKEMRDTLEESAKIERTYKHFFDLTIVNERVENTYKKLRRAMESLSTEPQWVPISWVY